MPSTKKTLHFLSSALATSIAVGLMGFGMTRQWAKVTMDCARGGTGLFNGSAVVTLKLFDGYINRVSCPAYGDLDDFEVIPKLIGTDVTALVLHALVLCLLVLCLLFSATSILISIYNSVSNPYETYVGPMGVYVSSSLSACLSVVALIIFVLNVNFTGMAEELVKIFAGTIPVDLRDKSSQMLLGYFLVIPYAAFSLLSIAVIYMYEHAAYTHRREQQRPTEDAPREIMMY